MNVKSEYNRNEFKNKSKNLTFKQITNSNLSKIRLCELIIPYCIVSDWYNLNIFFSEMGMIASQDDFKKSTDIIYNQLLNN